MVVELDKETLEEKVILCDLSCSFLRQNSSDKYQCILSKVCVNGQPIDVQYGQRGLCNKP